MERGTGKKRNRKEGQSEGVSEVRKGGGKNDEERGKTKRNENGNVRKCERKNRNRKKELMTEKRDGKERGKPWTYRQTKDYEWRETHGRKKN